MVIEHIRSSTAPNQDFVIISTFKCIFYTLDLVFIFLPANRLKKEYHKVGGIIYNSSFTKLPQDLQRSVNILNSIFPYLNNNLNAFF